MHNPKINQTIIKDRTIPGSREERIVYIGVVCSHFDFACSSATSNIEPLGIEEAFLKASFSSFVLPANPLVCINKLFWLHPPLNKCSAVFNTIKGKIKDKGAILAVHYLWAATLLGEVVKFPPSPSAPCLLLTYHSLTSKSCIPSPWCFTLSSPSCSLYEIRKDRKFTGSWCVEGKQLDAVLILYMKYCNFLTLADENLKEEIFLHR